MSVARRMTVLRVTVPGQYFCTKHPDLNITAREIKNQAGTDCPCLRRNIHLCAGPLENRPTTAECPPEMGEKFRTYYLVRLSSHRS